MVDRSHWCRRWIVGLGILAGGLAEADADDPHAYGLRRTPPIETSIGEGDIFQSIRNTGARQPPPPPAHSTDAELDLESLFPAIGEQGSGTAATSGEAGASAAESGYGAGLDWSFWGWMFYALQFPKAPSSSTFWAYEAELDLTKSFGGNLAGAVDVDFVDKGHYGSELRLEQLYLTAALPYDDRWIATFGKFNAPFGVEPRDPWDRTTGFPSVIFGARPRDLTGFMVTRRAHDTPWQLQAFVVNGFEQSVDRNDQPSFGVNLEFLPGEMLRAGLAGWFGPEMPANNQDRLYFADAFVEWQPLPRTSVAGELVYGSHQAPGSMHLDWTGYLVELVWECSPSSELFVQWSDLNDTGGFILGSVRHQEQAIAGVAWYLHPQVRMQAQYQRAFRATDNENQFNVQVSFGG